MAFLPSRPASPREREVLPLLQEGPGGGLGGCVGGRAQEAVRRQRARTRDYALKMTHISDLKLYFELA